MKNQKTQDQDIKKFVRRNIKDLRARAKRERITYLFFSILLLLINLATLVVAIYAVVNLYIDAADHTSGKVTSKVQSLSIDVVLPLATLSAVVVVVIFILQIVAVIYRGISRDKFFKRALDKIQHEYMQYLSRRDEYNVKEPETILYTQVKDIFNKYTSKKNKASGSLFFRAMLGGRDA